MTAQQIRFVVIAVLVGLALVALASCAGDETSLGEGGKRGNDVVLSDESYTDYFVNEGGTDGKVWRFTTYSITVDGRDCLVTKTEEGVSTTCVAG